MLSTRLLNTGVLGLPEGGHNFLSSQARNVWKHKRTRTQEWGQKVNGLQTRNILSRRRGGEGDPVTNCPFSLFFCFIHQCMEKRETPAKAKISLFLRSIRTLLLGKLLQHVKPGQLAVGINGNVAWVSINDLSLPPSFWAMESRVLSSRKYFTPSFL